MLIYSKTEFLQKDTVKNRQNALKPKNKFSWNMQRFLSLSLSLSSAKTYSTKYLKSLSMKIVFLEKGKDFIRSFNLLFKRGF